MKNNGLLMLLSSIFLTLFLFACKKEMPKIRFYNATNANLFWKFGGCKYGDAKFLGKLNTISLTDYQEVKPSSYYVEMQNPQGQWIPVTTKKIGPVTYQKNYSIWLTSNIQIKTDVDGNILETGNDNVTLFAEIKQD